MTFKIGTTNEQQTFRMNRNRLVKHSNFFKTTLAMIADRVENTALVKHEDESADPEVEDSFKVDGGMLTFDDMSANAFDCFFRFLSSGAVAFGNKDKAEQDNEGTEEADFDDIVQCWALGEKLQSTSFKDAVTDVLISKVVAKQAHPTTMHEGIYPVSTSQSAIRMLLVDIAKHFWTWQDMGSWEDKGCKQPEFFFDLAAALNMGKRVGAGGFGGPGFTNEYTCIYHEHVAEGKACYKTMFRDTISSASDGEA